MNLRINSLDIVRKFGYNINMERKSVLKITEVNNMYANLLSSLNCKGISVNAAAKVVGMPESTLRTKIYERSFDLEEAFMIRDNLFPEYDIRYLFERTETKLA